MGECNNYCFTSLVKNLQAMPKFRYCSEVLRPGSSVVPERKYCASTFQLAFHPSFLTGFTRILPVPDTGICVGMPDRVQELDGSATFEIQRLAGSVQIWRNQGCAIVR